MTATDGAGGSTRLDLVRHGETVWHTDNRYAGGGSDVDLTDLGREQAEDLRRWAVGQGFAAVVVSPVRRAIETARPTAMALHLEMEVVEDLREVDFGIAEGRTMHELQDLDAGMAERFRSDPVAHPFPGAEPPERAAARSGAALREVARRHPGAAVLVVAHNTLLRLALCSLLDLPVTRYRQLFPRLENVAITRVAVPQDPAANAGLLTLNAPAHPTTTAPPE